MSESIDKFWITLYGELATTKTYLRSNCTVEPLVYFYNSLGGDDGTGTPENWR